MFTCFIPMFPKRYFLDFLSVALIPSTCLHYFIVIYALNFNTKPPYLNPFPTIINNHKFYECMLVKLVMKF